MNVPAPDVGTSAPASQERTGRETRGRMKIFFGYAAGVGKTYSMLEAARQQASAGVDVVVGYVEPHGRPETEALLKGLEILPQRSVNHRGIRLRDFSLNRALERRPQLIVVDELAHTNPSGSRHPKRYGDIAELLDAGIDVYTTVNVQHIESLNDVVTQITGVSVRETVPDAVFDQADDVKLVDLPPEELLQRLHEGKVYVPKQAERAMSNFFRRANLIALREIALRRTADRVSEQGRTERLASREMTRWGTNEHILVCVVPRETSGRVIRAARRLAAALHAQWTAVYVETPRAETLSSAAKDRLRRNLALAERLGARVIMLSGEDPVAEIVAWANSHDVTKILVGQGERPSWWHRFSSTLTERLLRRCGEIDVSVIRARKPDRAERDRSTRWRARSIGARGWLEIALALSLSVLAGRMFAHNGMHEANIIMAFLPAVVFAAVRYGRFAGGLVSVASVLLFDFLFTKPYYTFVVYDLSYAVTFLVMLAVAFTLSTLTDRLRRQVRRARERELQTEALYRLTEALSGRHTPRQLGEEAERQLGELFEAEVAVFLPSASGQLHPIVGGAGFAAISGEVAVAQWVFQNRQPAGPGAENLPLAQARYFPLMTAERCVGVLGLRLLSGTTLDEPDELALLEACIGQVASAIARETLAEEARRASVLAETERMRNTLLSTVSHDLRTPLTAMAGSASALSVPGEVPEGLRCELAGNIEHEARRMSRLVENLLAMSRLEQGEIRLHLEWQPLEEIVGSALSRATSILGERQVLVSLEDAPSLVALDGVLFEQLLLNLLENAARYTPADAPIEIASHRDGEFVVLTVRDHGPGVNPADVERIFEKFTSGVGATSESRGSGLGLAICKAIAEAHGGSIRVENAPDGGACFQVSIPWAGWPPLPVPGHIEEHADEW